MKDIYLRSKSEANYTATYFLAMLSNYGGLEFAALSTEEELHIAQLRLNQLGYSSFRAECCDAHG